MYLLLSTVSQAWETFSSIAATICCCCIAAFIFFLALALYSMARGGFVFRVGNFRARPPTNYGARYEPERPPQEHDELKAIRSSEKVLCEYCGTWVDSTESKCPHCGAPLEKSH